MSAQQAMFTRESDYFRTIASRHSLAPAYSQGAVRAAHLEPGLGSTSKAVRAATMQWDRRSSPFVQMLMVSIYIAYSTVCGWYFTMHTIPINRRESSHCSMRRNWLRASRHLQMYETERNARLRFIPVPMTSTSTMEAPDSQRHCGVVLRERSCARLMVVLTRRFVEVDLCSS